VRAKLEAAHPSYLQGSEIAQAKEAP
jgi:hypothetical protein